MGIEQPAINVKKWVPISAAAAAAACFPRLVKRYVINSDRNKLYKVEIFRSRRSPTEDMRFLQR